MQDCNKGARGDECARDCLLFGEVYEKRGMRYYTVKQLLKLLKFIPEVKGRCLLMRMINTVG